MTDNTPRVRPFSDFLREHAKGRTHDELGDTLHTLIRKVQDTGKAGTLALTLQVKPLKDDARLVVVSDKIKVSLPEHDRPTAVWFVDAEGNLTRDDPDQLVFESLREVPAGVDPATGEVLDGTHG